MLIGAGLVALVGVGAALYLGSGQDEAPTQPTASAAGVIQLPLPEFAASEPLPPGPLEERALPHTPVALALPPAEPQAPRSRRLYVRAEALNVRKGPGTDTSVLRQVNRGQELTELDRRPQWVKVRVEGTDMVGWVYSTYVDSEAR